MAQGDLSNDPPYILNQGYIWGSPASIRVSEPASSSSSRPTPPVPREPDHPPPRVPREPDHPPPLVPREPEGPPSWQNLQEKAKRLKEDRGLEQAKKEQKTDNPDISRGRHQNCVSFRPFYNQSQFIYKLVTQSSGGVVPVPKIVLRFGEKSVEEIKVLLIDYHQVLDRSADQTAYTEGEIPETNLRYLVEVIREASEKGKSLYVG